MKNQLKWCRDCEDAHKLPFPTEVGLLFLGLILTIVFVLGFAFFIFTYMLETEEMAVKAGVFTFFFLCLTFFAREMIKIIVDKNTYFCMDKEGNVHLHKVKPLLHRPKNETERQYFYFDPRIDHSHRSLENSKPEMFTFMWYIRVPVYGLFHKGAIVVVPQMEHDFYQSGLALLRILRFNRIAEKLVIDCNGIQSVYPSLLLRMNFKENLDNTLGFALDNARQNYELICKLKACENQLSRATRDENYFVATTIIPAILALNDRSQKEFKPSAHVKTVRENLEASLENNYSEESLNEILRIAECHLEKDGNSEATMIENELVKQEIEKLRKRLTQLREYKLAKAVA